MPKIFKIKNPFHRKTSDVTPGLPKMSAEVFQALEKNGVDLTKAARECKDIVKKIDAYEKKLGNMAEGDSKREKLREKINECGEDYVKEMGRLGECVAAVKSNDKSLQELLKPV